MIIHVYQLLLLLNTGWSSQKCCPASLLLSAKLGRCTNHKIAYYITCFLLSSMVLLKIPIYIFAPHRYSSFGLFYQVALLEDDNPGCILGNTMVWIVIRPKEDQSCCELSPWRLLWWSCHGNVVQVYSILYSEWPKFRCYMDRPMALHVQDIMVLATVQITPL